MTATKEQLQAAGVTDDREVLLDALERMVALYEGQYDVGEIAERPEWLEKALALRFSQSEEKGK